MPVLYNQTPIVPAPIVTVSTQYETLADGTYLGPLYTLTLHGTIVAVPPGTAPVESSARLGVLLAKQAALETQFSVSGKTLEIYSPDGSQITVCNPIVKSVDFTEGVWVELTEYTIQLETRTFYPGPPIPPAYVTDVTDDWQIEEEGYSVGVGPVWRVTRNVSAKGALTYDANGNPIPAWQQARNWVIQRMASGFNSRPFDSSSELNLKTATYGYNHKRVESSNAVDGSFSVTETWILAYNVSATEQYTVSVKYAPEELVDTTVSISGTIQGLSNNLNQPTDRLTNATAFWNSSVQNNLFERAQDAVSGITLVSYGSSGNVDYNEAEGTITYNYEFNNRPVVSNSPVGETYTVSKRSSLDASEVTVQVQGTIQGLLNIGEPSANLVKYQRAKIYFDTINTPGFMLTRANQSGVPGLQAAPAGTDTSFNFFEGNITYSFEFNNRLNNLARNEYTTTIRTSREDRRTNVSISGTITGFRQSDTDSILTKYNNALAFWNIWQPQMQSMAAALVPSAALHPVPLTQSQGNNQYAGTITYDVEYNTDMIPTIEGALAEVISISGINPSDVYAVVPILGRSGPILQDMSTKKELGTTLNIDVIMKVGYEQPNTDDIVATYKPVSAQVFVDRDEIQWVDNTGHYSRTVTWVYGS